MASQTSEDPQGGIVGDELLECKQCSTLGCPYRARKRSVYEIAEAPNKEPSCCISCGEQPSAEETPPHKRARVCQSSQKHDCDCPRFTMELCRECWWERVWSSPGKQSTPDAFLVVPPKVNTAETAGPYPVILFLTGRGHVDGKEDFLWAGVDILVQNPQVREHCYVIAPIPQTAGGLLREDADGWGVTWDEDNVWTAFMEVLKRAGTEKIDMHRLYVTGYSMGAAGVWHLALKYGKHLAAIAPISGACQWPGNSWSGKEPDPEVLSQLSELALRAYQIDVDTRAGHPEKDMMWLAWHLGLEESSAPQEITLRGLEEHGTKVVIGVRSWSARSKKAKIELHKAKGPLFDWSYWGEQGDSHCLWYRVYPFAEYGLLQWMLQQSISRERVWICTPECGVRTRAKFQA